MCQLAPNSWVKEDKKWFVVEINCKENCQLVNNLTHIFNEHFKINKAESKDGETVVMGNLFRKIKVYK